MKTKPSYNIICTFKEGKRRHTDTYECMSLAEAKEVMSEYLDVPKRGGEVVRPTLKGLKEALGAYCPDGDFLKNEYERELAAYKTWSKVVSFMESRTEMGGRAAFEFNGSETIVVEANPA